MCVYVNTHIYIYIYAYVDDDDLVVDDECES